MRVRRSHLIVALIAVISVCVSCGSESPDPVADSVVPPTATVTNAPTSATAIPTATPEPGAPRCEMLGEESAPRVWNDLTLAAIRREVPEPTIHARNLYHLSAVMWDSWAAYDPDAEGLYVTTKVDTSQMSETDMNEARLETIMMAAFIFLGERYRTDFHTLTIEHIDKVFFEVCNAWRHDQTGPNDASMLGEHIAETLLTVTRDDGSMVDDGAATAAYVPRNPPLDMTLLGSDLVDPDRWQPLEMEDAVSRNGLAQPSGPQDFFGWHWGEVESFALPPATDGMPIDPGPPPSLADPETRDDFHAGVLTTLRAGAALELGQADIDLSPGVNGAREVGVYDADGHEVNPATGMPYEPNPTDLADYTRVIAEFWADGPDSETPPGHWNVLANELSDALATADLRIGGAGAAVDRLEWDTKLYIALNGALHDAAIAAWGSKSHYDYVRPISMIRYMGNLGQSSDPDGASYHPDGLPLDDGLVEIITEESSAAGERHGHLAGWVGDVAVRGWLGQPAVPGARVSGVGWILAVSWLPYQQPTFITPAFPAYVSGHSTFSRSAAVVLSGFTGSPFFPGGLATHIVEPGGLRHEQGPSRPVILQWATYADAADEAGLSRLYGGIHVPADDLEGRKLGAEVGRLAWERAQVLYEAGG